jgi:hypothetical protein
MIADRQSKILHLLSAVHGSQGQSANSGLRAHLLPLLSKMDQGLFKMQVINFAAGDQHAPRYYGNRAYLFSILNCRVDALLLAQSLNCGSESPSSSRI